MEEYTRPLNERDKKIIAEMKIAEKLQKEEGCKLLDCNVVTNNINLRIEIIDLKREMREQEKIIELMAEYIDFDKIDLNCSSLCVKDNCREQCIIEYFKKKAKGEAT